MRFHDYPVAANVSLLFSELPYMERFAAAAAAGFTEVETWWPFADAVPEVAETTRLVEAIDTAGVRLTGLNFFAGDMPAGERGIATLPDRADELRANAAVVVDIARRTGCRSFNLLYGRLDADADAGRVAANRAISLAADSVAVVDGTVLLEPLAASLNGTYPLHTVEDVLDVIDGPLGGREDVRVLFDLFHLGSNGVDTTATATKYADRIGHVQLADAPGRGEPGSGELAVRETVAALRAAGYSGLLAAEYVPSRATTETLAWAEQ